MALYFGADLAFRRSNLLECVEFADFPWEIPALAGSARHEIAHTTRSTGARNPGDPDGYRPDRLWHSDLRIRNGEHADRRGLHLPRWGPCPSRGLGGGGGVEPAAKRARAGQYPGGCKSSTGGFTKQAGRPRRRSGEGGILSVPRRKGRCGRSRRKGAAPIL